MSNETRLTAWLQALGEQDRLETSSANGFRNYLKKALSFVLQAEKDKRDKGDLQSIHQVCRGDNKTKLAALTPQAFLENYLWCIGSIQKKIRVHEAHFPEQMELFRQCDAQRITQDAAAIREEWQGEKRDLNGRMVEAMVATAAKLVAQGWDAFRKEYLPEPPVECPDDWTAACNALDQLPMVGPAIAPFLLRNLFGAPVLKPDLHIVAIAAYFFGDEAAPVQALINAIEENWDTVCTDQRFLPVHLGEVDYILWFYRQATGQPKVSDDEAVVNRCDRFVLTSLEGITVGGVPIEEYAKQAGMPGQDPEA
jgi:hypothetical protein